jgi:predicted  nucleic acid-binding Zn-ribbon protein
LKEQLDLLWELQKIDLTLQEIRKERERYPREMDRLDEKQGIEKERVKQEREKIESLEKDRRQKEGHLSLEQEKVKRAEGKMFEVKTNKEYQALLKEIEGIKESNSKEEEEILRLMDEIEEVKKDLNRREKEMAATLTKIDTEKSVIQVGISESEGLWKRETARRDSLSKQLDSSLFRLYSTLREKRQGIGMVAVKRETCQGCFVNVPPQMYIEVQRNNALVRCPNCNRILYWEDRSEKKG